MAKVTKKSKIENAFLLILAEKKGKWYCNILHGEIRDKLTKPLAKTKVKLSKSQVWRAKKELNKAGFIQVLEPMKVGKGPKKEICLLTLFGLLKVLSYKLLEDLPYEDLKKCLDKIAENQSAQLPLLFGKWDYFDEHGFNGKIIERMREYFDFLSFDYFTKDFSWEDELMKKIQEAQERHYLYEFVLFFPIAHFHHDEATQWANVLVKDEELRQCINKLFIHYKSIHQPEFKKLDARKKLFEDLQKEF